ncbi:MAG: restriction endonuclease subunit S [Caenispirillum sp.]|nr:restriction endonuclease subunit S [Caenispirillum sp.]
MTFPAYPAYKNSGVEWLGEVPRHWRIDRLKRSTQSCRNGVWGDDPLGDDNDIPCVRVADFDRLALVVREDIPTLRNVRPEQQEGRVLRRGDLLIEKSGGGEQQSVGCVVLYDHDGPAVCSNFVARIALAEGMVASYWRYLHAAAYAVGLPIASIKQNTGIQNLDQSQYLDERAPFPPEAEQAAIAAFLDRETGKIDALVAEQEKLIELLKEKRQAVISHAVTKGLDPNVPMKDSGVEWLGEVPEHWEVRRVKDVARLESGHTPSKTVPEYWENCHINWVSLNDTKHLATSDYISDTAVKISELGMKNSSARLLPADSVVFTRDATIGLAAITMCEMAVSQHVIAWVPSERILATYLLRTIDAMKGYLDSYTSGATIKTIGMGDIRKLVTALPPLDEQQAIVGFLSASVPRIDSLMSEAQRAIDLLKERRWALISAAVTGKIDVRGLVDTSLAPEALEPA